MKRCKKKKYTIDEDESKETKKNVTSEKKIVFFYQFITLIKRQTWYSYYSLHIHGTRDTQDTLTYSEAVLKDWNETLGF